MSSLLTVIKRSTASMMAVEDYLAREHSATPGTDPTAPPAAGGAL